MKDTKLDEELSVWTGDDFLRTGMEFLYGLKDSFGNRILSGFHAIDSSTLGFRPGKLYLVKDYGEGSTSFIFTLLRNIGIEQKTDCFLLTDRFSRIFTSVALLGQCAGIQCTTLFSDFFLEKNIDRIEKCFEAGNPLTHIFAERFYEEDIEEIGCQIRDFISKRSAKQELQKGIVFLDGISSGNLRYIKLLSEELYIPMVVFMRQNHAECAFSDAEIFLRKGSSGTDATSIPYDLWIENRELMTGTSDMNGFHLNIKSGLFEEK